MSTCDRMFHIPNHLADYDKKVWENLGSGKFSGKFTLFHAVPLQLPYYTKFICNYNLFDSSKTNHRSNIRGRKTCTYLIKTYNSHLKYYEFISWTSFRQRVNKLGRRTRPYMKNYPNWTQKNATIHETQHLLCVWYFSFSIRTSIY